MTLLKTNVALRKNLSYRFLSIKKMKKSVFIDNKNYRFLTALLPMKSDYKCTNVRFRFS